MKICLISEGAYPYVTGGVSSWIQSVMMNMPEHEFVVYTISAKELKGAKPKYAPPANLTEMHEIHLDHYVEKEVVSGKRYDLSDEEREAFVSLIGSRETQWPVLFDFFMSGRVDSILNFLASKDFLDIVRILCREKFVHVPFTDMFWALRSMVLPLFVCIEHEMPEADLYHSVSTGYAGVLGALAKHRYQKPYLLTEHGIYTREREEEIIKADWIKGYFKDIWIDYFYNLSNCAYEFAGQVTSLYEGSRQIQIELGCPAEKTTVIPNGIDLNRFRTLQRQSRGDGIHIGAVIRVVPIKDVKTMLQAFSMVQESIPSACFYLIGPADEDEEYFEECMDLAKALDLKNLVFTGETDIGPYFQFLDILVLSSISEGQPLVILEGLAMGIPYVTTDVGSCAELLFGREDSFGPAGCVVPVMHFHLLAGEIERLARDASLRAQFGQNGQARVTNLYTLPLMISRYRSCYEGEGSYGGNRISAESTL